MGNVDFKIRYSDYGRICSFLKAVAECCLQEMDEESKQFIRDNPEAILYHFSIGLYIRNEFIYPQELIINKDVELFENQGRDTSTLIIDRVFIGDLIENADYYSQQIIEIMIERLRID